MMSDDTGSHDVVKRANAWDRCYPGNLNIEALVRDLTNEVEELRKRCNQQAAIIREFNPLYR